MLKPLLVNLVRACVVGLFITTASLGCEPGKRLMTGDVAPPISLEKLTNCGRQDSLGWAIDTDLAGNSVIVGSAMTADDIAMGLSIATGKPFKNETGSTDKYFVELTLAGTFDGFLRTLRKEFGLAAVPYEVVMPVTKVTRAN